MAAPFQLPASHVLAGPILRRAGRQSVSVWLATSREARLEGYVRFAARDATVRGRAVTPVDGPPLAHLGKGVADSRKLGQHLWVHLVSIGLTPEAAGFFPQGYPTETFLQYELYRDGVPLDLSSLAYPPFHAPTFFLRESGLVNVLHGSCRKLHGPGKDGLALADDILQWSAADLEQRPSALCLTGDQIYADDVAASIAPHLSFLARLLLGVDEKMPFGPAVSALGCGVARRRLEGVFTSTEMDHQLLGFGQFAAMYLMAWNEAMWPSELPRESPCRPFDPAVVERETRERQRLHQPPFPYASPDPAQVLKENRELEETRRTLPRVRRALANLPTYMIMDDHEVTDDWNLNGEWRRRSLQDPLARRAIANAMAAFWAFQGWGNDPQRFGPVGELVERCVAGGWTEAGEDEILGRHWDFATPPHPVVFFLDTRTQRDYPPESPGPPFRWSTAPPGLLDPRALQAFVERVQHHGVPSPLVVVAPAPVFGPATLDVLQRAISQAKGPEAEDFESWVANSAGLYSLKRAILEQIKPRVCVFLSGDVHYGYVASQLLQELRASQRSTLFLQFTASACKNEPGALAQKVLSALGETTIDLVWFPEGGKRFLSSLTPAQYELLTAELVYRLQGFRLLDWLRASQGLADADEGLPFLLDQSLALAAGVASSGQYRETTWFLPPDGTGGSGFITGQSNLGRLFVVPGLREGVRCELWRREGNKAVATVMTGARSA